MEPFYDLSNLPEYTYESLAQDLLNRVLKLRLESFQGSEANIEIDLWQQNNNGLVEVIVNIIDPVNIYASSYKEVLNKTIIDIDIYKPQKYILIDFTDSNSSLLSEINTLKLTKIIYYGIDWIQKQLNNHSDIAVKYNIKLTSDLPPSKTKASNEQDKRKVEQRGSDTGIDQINKLFTSNINFFALGHKWGEDDQMQRFIKEGIWENGHEVKRTKVVERIKKGDVVFIQSSYSGYLRIKVIGVVIENTGDGHKILVNWNPIKSIDLPGRGAYRSAIAQIGKRNVVLILKDLYKKLPKLFDIIAALKRESKKSKQNIDTDLPKTSNGDISKYWWLNTDKTYWNTDDLEVGHVRTHKVITNNRIGHFHETKKGELGILYQKGAEEKTRAIFEVAEEPANEVFDEIVIRIKYRFKSNEQISLEELKKNSIFKESDVVIDNNQNAFYELTKEEFQEACSLSSFLESSIENYSELTKTILDNDGAYTTEDLLDIENDVRSFALILASKDIKPPLAIALFGKWGSGKSFFIEHLIKRVNELSIKQGFLEDAEDFSTAEKITEEAAFCKGIAQIKFNAWSYLDANLWAGLASSIFEKLDEYISNRSKGDCEKLKLRNHLSQKLEILSFERENIKQEKGTLEDERNGLIGKLDKLKFQKDEIVKNVAEKNLSDIVNEVIDRSNLEEETKKQLQKYGITKERINELSPDELYKEAKSWLSFVKSLFKLPVSYFVAFTAALLLILTITIDPFEIVSKIFNELSKSITLVISIAGPIFATIYNSVSKFKKFIKPITDYKNKFNKELEAAKFAYNRELELLDLHITNKQAEIEQTESQIKNLDNQIYELEYTLDNFIAKRAFNDFVKRKIGDKGYEAHLGLISIIRKDFETLSDLFREIQVDRTAPEEIQKEQLEKQKTHKEIVELFKDEKALDRIILYIDDLDRCSDEKVLEVIQAVHLLMAFPLFNVVVGVDKRCVNNALIYKNLVQYSQFESLNEIKKTGIHVISPSEYLEKIFQIPFQLDDPSEKNIKRMVHAFLNDQVEKETHDDVEINVEDELSEITDELNAFEQVKEKPKIEDIVPEEVEEEEVMEKKKTITPQDLKLTQEEFDLLKEMIWLVGTVPRTIKRFLNIYRIVRAHQDLEIDVNQKRKEYLAIMFILGVNIGENKKHAPELMKCIESNKDLRLTDIIDHDDVKDPKSGLRYFNEIRNKIERTETIQELNQMKAEVLSKHIPLVGRFSFGSIDNNGDDDTIIEEQNEMQKLLKVKKN